MKYTVEIPFEVVHGGEDLERIARAVDRLGFDALAVTEHPAPSRAWVENPPGHPTFDIIAALAFCAGITERVRLMTFLAVLPYHRPFMLAKALSTIDVVSRGRLTAVVGAGYLKAEFDALGVPFEKRNELFDESLELLREIWSGAPVTKAGMTFDAQEIVSKPLPVQPGGPPLWVGGNGQRARERAARAGGWSPLLIGQEAAERINTAAIDGVDALARDIAAVRDRARDLRGADADVQVQVLTPQARVMFAEHSVAEHRDYVSALSDAGVDWFIVRVPGSDAAQAVEHLEYYAAELML